MLGQTGCLACGALRCLLLRTFSREICVNVTMQLFTCLLLTVLGTSVGFEELPHGQVECLEGVVKCDPGYVYSREDLSVRPGLSPSLGQCRRHQWAAAQEGECLGLDEEFPVPRVPRAGWSVCITATPTQYTRITVDLNGEGRHIIVGHFDIRMKDNYGPEFDHSIVVNEMDDRLNYPWLREDTYHPKPYPFAVGKEFKLKVKARDEHTLVYHVNGRHMATRSVTHPVSLVKDVTIVGDVDVTKVDTWCA